MHFFTEEVLLWIMDSYFSQKRMDLSHLLSSPDVNWWTGVLWIIVMFLSDSHSDGTHSLQSIHCWDTDAVMHFYKPDEDTHLHAYSKCSYFGWAIPLNILRSVILDAADRMKSSLRSQICSSPNWLLQKFCWISCSPGLQTSHATEPEERRKKWRKNTLFQHFTQIQESHTKCKTPHISSKSSSAFNASQKQTFVLHCKHLCHNIICLYISYTQLFKTQSCSFMSSCVYFFTRLKVFNREMLKAWKQDWKQSFLL